MIVGKLYVDIYYPLEESEVYLCIILTLTFAYILGHPPGKIKTLIDQVWTCLQAEFRDMHNDPVQTILEK